MRTQRPTDRRSRPRRAALTRRGVVSVLAMMFLVMFGSLAAAMAVVTQGNLRAASSHLRMTRALGAVDTGMQIAAQRLTEAASRVVSSKGEIDADYALDLWNGTYSGEWDVTILDAPYGRSEPYSPTSVSEILALHHAYDDLDNVVLEDADNAPQGIDLPTAPTGWVVSNPIGLSRDPSGLIVTAAQVTYIPPDDNGEVMVVVTGYDWDPVRGRWVTRTSQQSFRVTRLIDHAVIGSTRIMLGQGAIAEGPMGINFDSDAIDSIDAPPLVAKSDFYGLDNALDAKLDDFYAAVLDYDIDGDNRLRTKHAGESAVLDSLNVTDYDGDTAPDNAFTDKTKDDTIDEFDIFLAHFDTNGDGRVVCSEALIDGTPAQGKTPEFEINDGIALGIDGGAPDRNKNGWFNGHFMSDWDWDSFPDNNGDGVLNGSDYDADDVTLGYRDGYLDYKDQYAKIRGTVWFRASRSQWEEADDGDGSPIGDYQTNVQGSIRAASGDPAVVFEATETELPELGPEQFAEASSALKDIAAEEGLTFDDQVAASKGGGWTPPTTIEPTPYGAPSPADYYERPVYSGITFKNVTIPMGTNALFIDCEFIGVTYVEAYEDNTHESWMFYGQQERDPVTGDLYLKYPPPPAESDAALDKSYADPGDIGYDDLPDPLMIDTDDDGLEDTQFTDTKALSNNLRFHNCLIVGSIVTDQPTNYASMRNKLVFTGATRFAQTHPDHPADADKNPDPDDLKEIAKSSLMAPQYSVDIGSTMSPPEQNVRLDGAVIAGVLDMRGRSEIHGVLLMTYKPVYGEAPMLSYGEAIGNPGSFNVTLGHFGEEDGDLEGLGAGALEDLDGDDVLDIGWDSARDEDGALIPLDEFPGSHDDSWYDGIPDTDVEDAGGDYVRRTIPFYGSPGTDDHGPVPASGPTRLIPKVEMVLPDGLPMPISIVPRSGSYIEGRVVIEEGD